MGNSSPNDPNVHTKLNPSHYRSKDSRDGNINSNQMKKERPSTSINNTGDVDKILNIQVLRGEGDTLSNVFNQSGRSHVSIRNEFKGKMRPYSPKTAKN